MHNFKASTGTTVMKMEDEDGEVGPGWGDDEEIVDEGLCV